MVKVVLVSPSPHHKVEIQEVKLYDKWSDIKDDYTDKAIEKYNLENKDKSPRTRILDHFDREINSRNFEIIGDQFGCCVGDCEQGTRFPGNNIDGYFLHSSYRRQDGINLFSSSVDEIAGGYGNFVIYKRHAGRLVDMSIEDFESLYLFLNKKKNTVTKKTRQISENEMNDHLTSGASVCAIM